MGYAIVKMGHLNLWRESNDRQAQRDLLVMTSTGITSLNINEGRRHVDDVRDFCKNNPQWAFFTARNAKPHASPNEMNNIILLRKDVWDARNVYTRKMCNATSGSPDRHMLTVKADHKQSGRVFRHRCTHMNSHIEVPAWHRLPRFPQYQMHNLGLQDVMDTKGHIIDVLSMDLNANYRRHFVRTSPLYPYKPLRKLDIPCNYDILGTPPYGTKGNRLIDAFFAHEDEFEFVEHEIILGLNSDHNGLWVKGRVQVV